MKYANLSKDEYELVNELLNITIKIKNSYDNLYQLEIKKQQQSKEYDEVVLKLKKYCKREDELYSTLKRNFSKISNILNFFKENYEDKLENSNFFKQILEFDDSFVVIRIITKLSKNYIDGFGKRIRTEDLEIFKSINNSFEMKKFILLDILRCFLSIATNINIDKIKYSLGYIYSEIEEEMIKNKFDVKKNPYISFKVFGQINKLPMEIINEISKIYCLGFYNFIINEMLKYDDEALENEKIKEELVLKQIFLRAIFILLDDETIMELNSIFHDRVDENNFENKDKIIEMVINSYRKVKRDRSIPKIISLKL